MKPTNPPLKIPLEVAVFSSESILVAQAQGASRVEINAPNSYATGGTTPPTAQLASVSKQVRIPVRIMIRPRGPPADAKTHDFVYSPAEVEAMAESIRQFKASGLLDPRRHGHGHGHGHGDGDGFVFGLLRHPADKDKNKNNPNQVEIDEENCSRLVQLAWPYRCVFHRAFDAIAASGRASEGMQLLTDIGFGGVLTAGGLGGVNVESMDLLCRAFAGKLELVVGGGLRCGNVLGVARHLASFEKGTVWMHTAALTDRPGYPPEEIDSDELVRMVGLLGSVEAA